MLSGLRIAVATEFSVAYKVALSVIFLVVSFISQQWIELTLIFFATGLMLIAELFNSALEALCDFVESRPNEQIRIIKDISAAAVGISILVWAVTLILESSHLWSLLKS